MRSYKYSNQSLGGWLISSLIEALFLNWSSRVKLTRLALGILILMNLRTFEYFPGFRIFQDAWYGVTLIAFILLYPLLKIATDWTFTRIELYLIGILPVLFILPAFTANSVFGQPLYFGIFPQRSALPVLWWILLINAWRLRWVREEDLKVTLLFLSWALFILFNAMRLVLKPGNFDQVGFVVGTGGDASFTFPIYLGVFSLCYYVFRGLRERRVIFYLLGLLQFVSALGHSGRSLSVTIVLTLLFYVLRFRGFARSIPIVGTFVVLLGLTIGVGLLVNPADTEERLSKYSDAFKVVGGASEVQDISANARIYETNTAKPYIAAHPILGVGAVSLQWEGGLVAAVGEYFVPGDIGVVGIMFTYGLFGLLVFLAQYIFVSSWGSGTTGHNKSAFLDATRGIVLFSALYSTVTGLFVFGIEASSFFIVLVTLVTSRSASNTESLLEPNRPLSPQVSVI